MTPKRCDVCGTALSPRGRGATKLCYPCRMAGASFVRRWMRDLRAAGVSVKEIAEITGTAANGVRARIREEESLRG